MDSESNLYSLGMVGLSRWRGPLRRALRARALRAAGGEGEARRLHDAGGGRCPSWSKARRSSSRAAAGRVTSARPKRGGGRGHRSRLGFRRIARVGTRVEIVIDRLRRGARITSGAFFDLSGLSGCAREPRLPSTHSLRRERDHVAARPWRARGRRSVGGVADPSLAGIVEIRGTSPWSRPAAPARSS